MRVIKSDETRRGAVRELWDYCFQDGREFSDWYFKNRVKDENVLIAEDDVAVESANTRRVMSALQMNETRLSVRGCPMEASCIVGVSTWPEFRGHGLAGGLLGRSIVEMKEKAVLVSTLYPYDYSFYARFGWNVICRQAVISLEMTDLVTRRFTMPEGYFARPLDLAGRGDIAMLGACMARCMKSYSGQTIAEEHMRQKLEECALENGYGYAVCDGDEPGVIKAFMLYTARQESIDVTDFVFGDIRGARGLLALILSHSSTASRALLTVPEDSLLHHILNVRDKTALNPHTMARVVDLQSATGAIMDKPAVDSGIQPCVVCVRDKLGPWNDGNWLIGPGECRKTAKEAQISCDIGTYTQLLFGYISVGEAELLGTLEVYEREAAVSLDRLLPKCPVYLKEMY